MKVSLKCSNPKKKKHIREKKKHQITSLFKTKGLENVRDIQKLHP